MATERERLDVGIALPILDPPAYNRKDRSPSRTMYEPDGYHYRCPWIEESITVHSDGNVSCGLDDPHSQRSFGNVKTQPIAEIFTNPEYRHLKEKLWAGHRCIGCGLYRKADASEGLQRDEDRPTLPKSLVLESTVTCNIRCPNTACLPNNDPNETTRDAAALDLATVEHVADQLAGGLETIHFYNYGEPFMNKRAEDMMLALRERCPGALMVTSTNGIPLSNPARADKVVLAAPDRIIFTISGVTQDAYGRYHVGGKVEQALAGIRNVCEARRRLGQARTTVIVRYLVFHWNDRDDQIDAAIAMAEDYGVDRLSLFLTDEPKGARSRRFSPGSPSFLKYRKYIHLDHAGRLDHLYHCEQPDANGLFRPEDNPVFGRVRKTASRATLRRYARKGVFRLAVASDRWGGQSFTLRAPWAEFAYHAPEGSWREIRLHVPRTYRRPGPLAIALSTDQYWFPADEDGVTDLRCLGLIVSDEAGPTARRIARLRWLAAARRAWRVRIAPSALGRLIRARPRRPLTPAPPGEAPREPARPQLPLFARAVERLYQTCFGRPPRPDERNGWMGPLLDGRTSLIQVAQDFVASDEFRKVHGDAPSPDTFVAAACRNALGHEPAPAEHRRWADFLARHGTGRAALAATALGIADAFVTVDASENRFGSFGGPTSLAQRPRAARRQADGASS